MINDKMIKAQTGSKDIVKIVHVTEDEWSEGLTGLE